MFDKTMQNIALTYILIGISGIAGAIENRSGLIASLLLLASGTVVMYLEYKQIKEKLHITNGKEGKV